MPVPLLNTRPLQQCADRANAHQFISRSLPFFKRPGAFSKGQAIPSPHGCNAKSTKENVTFSLFLVPVLAAAQVNTM
jgi:hypothetical protein